LKIAPTSPVVQFQNREPPLKWFPKEKRTSYALHPPLTSQCDHSPSGPRFCTSSGQNPPQDRSSPLPWIRSPRRFLYVPHRSRNPPVYPPIRYTRRAGPTTTLDRSEDDPRSILRACSDLPHVHLRPARGEMLRRPQLMHVRRQGVVHAPVPGKEDGQAAHGRGGK